MTDPSGGGTGPAGSVGPPAGIDKPMGSGSAGIAPQSQWAPGLSRPRSRGTVSSRPLAATEGVQYDTMMEPRVYIETTIPSYLTAWPSRDLVRAAHQQITRE
jgi:hypothetical protein